MTRIRLSPRALSRPLLALALVFFALSLAGDLIGRTPAAANLWPLMRQFDFVEEGNLANWYQSGCLLLGAVLAALAAADARGQGSRFARHWTVIAVTLLALSADECAQIHELTVTPYLQYLGDGLRHGEPAAGSGPALRKALWMIPYGVVLAAIAAAFWRFFFSLPPATRRGFIFSASLFVSGAVGAELLTDVIADRMGDQSVLYMTVNNASELLEMLGVAVFARTMAGHLAANSPVTEIVMEQDSP